ncbi:MAG: ABC transporter ATP-binding protein [Synechococcaceae cyanobacterium]|nr:ABC transporter ATP-binding protein [Synechococcaceae cyanobacterium]
MNGTVQPPSPRSEQGAAGILSGAARSIRTLLLAPFGRLFGGSPSARLVRRTARQEWRLITVNLITSVVEAFTEGATFAVIFLAVELLTGATKVIWKTKPGLTLVPWLTDWLDRLPSTGLFLILIGVAVLLQAVQSITRYVNALSTGYFGARVGTLITSRLHSQILALSFACASRYRIGDLLNTSNIGPRAVEQQIQQIGQILVNLLLIFCYLVVLLALSPWLLLAALLMGGVISLVQNRLLPRIRKGSFEKADLNVQISTRVTEDIQGLRLLHTTGQCAEASHNLQSHVRHLEQVLRKQTTLLEMVGPISSFLPVAAIGLIASLSILVFGGKSTGVMPSLVTFVLALQRLNIRISMVANNSNALVANAGNLERIDIILRSDDKEFRRLGGLPFAGLEREIRFRDVQLRYQPDLPPAVNQINLVIPKGKVVALVGTSGSGKSSLADLLVGLYAPTRGQIEIDGIPLESLDLSSWQQRLGVVSQDTFLFNATLAENIAFGTPHASRAEIIAAAELAQAAGFITRLPDGYETAIGERGYRLSGGQRQRISLARAILRNPDLLILDEATSALDSRSERLVQTAIEQFEQNHTVLVIAHRLSTIINADVICVMEAGRIIERGTHQALLALNGSYSHLWQQQSEPTLQINNSSPRTGLTHPLTSSRED